VVLDLVRYYDVLLVPLLSLLQLANRVVLVVSTSTGSTGSVVGTYYYGSNRIFIGERAERQSQLGTTFSIWTTSH